MGCFQPDQPSAPSYGQLTRQTLNAQLNLAPQLYEAEAAYQPLYDALKQGNLEGTLTGSEGRSVQVPVFNKQGKQTGTQTIQIPGTQGLLNLYKNQVAPALAGVNTASRTADINDVTNLAPGARGAMRASDPFSAAMLDTLNTQAQGDLDLGTALNPAQMRTVQQAIRARQSAAGMGRGPADIYGEAIAGSQAGQDLLERRRGFASGVIGQNQQFYGDPFMQIMGRSSGAAVPIAGSVGTGQGMMTGNLFNPTDPAAQGMNSQALQYAAMFSQPSMMSKIGQVGKAGGQLASLMGMFM